MLIKHVHKDISLAEKTPKNASQRRQGLSIRMKASKKELLEEAFQNTGKILLQGSGLWQRLNAVKPISCEPRGSGDDFDAVMTRYYEGIQRGVGGLFFAVCRGKV